MTATLVELGAMDRPWIKNSYCCTESWTRIAILGAVLQRSDHKCLPNLSSIKSQDRAIPKIQHKIFSLQSKRSSLIKMSLVNKSSKNKGQGHRLQKIITRNPEHINVLSKSLHNPTSHPSHHHIRISSRL